MSMSRNWARWLPVLVSTVGLTAWGYSRTAGRVYTEWNFFELGARTLVGYHHNPLYGGGALHLYVANPQLQIGPPALWSIAAFEWLPVHVVAALFVAVMAIIGLGAVAAVTAAGRAMTAAGTRALSWPTVAAAAVVAGIWGYDCGTWRHLDDAGALLAVAVAVAVIARGGRWWVVGLLLGTAAAAKPWAVILVPIVLAMPRRDVARALLVTIVTGALWWAPFVIAAPETTSALGHYIVVARPGSVLHLIGISGQVQGWLRPTQFMIGGAIGCFVVLRREWTAAPLAALAVRVLTDPYSYAYYGLGPMLAAFLVDSTAQRRHGFPTFTAAAVLVEFVVPPLGLGSTTIAVVKLIWGVSTLAAVLVKLPRRSPESRTTPYEEPAAIRQSVAVA